MKEMINFLKKTLEESKSELSTVGFQLASLGSFMGSLGYVYKNPNGTTFIYKGENKDFPKELSWKDAVTLHNAGGFVITKTGKLQLPQNHSYYHIDEFMFLNDASKASPLMRIYLQWNKKKKTWQVTKNLVKFNQEYFDE